LPTYLAPDGEEIEKRIHIDMRLNEAIELIKRLLIDKDINIIKRISNEIKNKFNENKILFHKKDWINYY